MKKYAIGLDIGTTSIGWAVINLEDERIEDIGVRIFERPENPKNGKSLAEPRRTARSARRRLKRRRQRLNFIKQFFIENSLLSEESIERVLTTPHNPYLLREKGTKEELTNEELFVALYHIAKRRGYKSNRKSADEKDAEGSKVLSAIAENNKLLAEYTTVATALNHNDKFAAHKRNKADNYSNSFVRSNFLDEAQLILKKQQNYKTILTDDAINSLLNTDGRGAFFQRPFMSHELIQEMLGNCQFEPNEHRAPKASLSFEIFRIAQDLAHLTYNGGMPLTKEEIASCIEKAKTTQKVTYKAIREVLGHKNDSDLDFYFDYIRGKDPSVDDLKKDRTAKEKNVFAELKFYHAIKKALKDTPEEWDIIRNDTVTFNKIGYILTVYKEDGAIKSALKEIDTLSDDSIAAIMSITSFSGFAHLSIVALDKITPYILEGNTYDKAVELAGYQFKQKLSGDKNRLPALNKDEANQITNPVVKRAISQTIKVINAIIAKYGEPSRIGLECASELNKNFSERRDIKKRQDENAELNEKIVQQLKKEFHIPSPAGLQITKFKFYREQDGKCLYCGQPLDINALFSDEHYGEVDHIIPLSRCGNDSRINKVLVHNACNQNKRNQTPYETWGDDARKWHDFEAIVNSNLKIPYAKKQRLLATTPPKEDWNTRAINDTRYISRFMTQFIRKNLKFAKDETAKQRIITPAGGMTSYLRRVWHVGSKDRDESNLHHAADAAIIALINQGVIQRISTLNKYYELFSHSKTDEVVDKINGGEIIKREELNQTKHDIEPWAEFGKEVRLRTSELKSNEKLADWRDQFRALYARQGDFIQNITPIFVSRMPKRNGTGQTNQETIRSPKGYLDTSKASYIRTPLSSITLEILEDSPIKHSDSVLYAQLKQLLKDNNNDAKKAFALPVYKGNKTIDKNGHLLSPVRSIKIDDSKNVKSGILINNETQFVNNGSTIKLNLYQHDKGIFAAPVYAHSIHKEAIEILPSPNGRTATDKAFWDRLREPDGKVLATEDNGFVKLFSVFPNDYLFLETKRGEQREGYYVKYGIGSGNIVLIPHTSSSKDSHEHINIGTGTISSIKHLDVSILGDNHPWS